MTGDSFGVTFKSELLKKGDIMGDMQMQVPIKRGHDFLLKIF